MNIDAFLLDVSLLPTSLSWKDWVEIGDPPKRLVDVICVALELSSGLTPASLLRADVYLASVSEAVAITVD